MTNAPGTPTEVCAVVATPLEIWVGTGTAHALEFLGRTINGASIEEIPYFGPIASDEYGGDAGPPADYQLFGTQHRISLEMTKFDPTILAKLDSFYNKVGSPTVGVGSLMSCSSLTTRLLMNSANLTTFVRNYPAVLILDPIEWAPIGSQASRARITFTANATTGVTPWNNTTT